MAHQTHEQRHRETPLPGVSPRPCSACGVSFRPTAARWRLCAKCYSAGGDTTAAGPDRGPAVPFSDVPLAF